jgi:hypothetical protein
MGGEVKVRVKVKGKGKVRVKMRGGRRWRVRGPVLVRGIVPLSPSLSLSLPHSLSVRPVRWRKTASSVGRWLVKSRGDSLSDSVTAKNAESG